MDPAEVVRPVGKDELTVTEGFDISSVSKFVNFQRLENLPKWDWADIFGLLAGDTLTNLDDP